ncbi:beta-propeller domain-containing protein [Candidatus Woesearchaeota archaeon]|nr:beta-propeller domain-containing protein [Candidatus Woesearchaeota archaeon]
MEMENKFLSSILAVLFLVSVLSGCEEIPVQPSESKIAKFTSGEELLNAFEEARESGAGSHGFMMDFAVSKSVAVAEGATAPQAAGSEREFSETNIQVEGVDEADIIKTDGDYIYTIARGNLAIAKAYPAEDAEILSTTKLGNFYPQELFIHKDRLLIFGSSSYRFEEPAEETTQGGAATEKMIAPGEYYPRYRSFMTVKLYDISDREEPELIKNIDFEGSYLTSRKIGEYAYFVVNSYPRYWEVRPVCEDIVPLYRASDSDEEPELEDMEPIAKCTDIGYIRPIQAENFITVASMSMEDEDADVNKEVIVGSGQNVYASLENMYIAQTSWPRYNALGELVEGFVEQTVITKFGMDNGDIEFLGSGEVKGHILNQFSMDEYDGHFRIATTAGEVWGGKSTNNVYVLDEELEVVGELEDLAPGEKIYSVRFMGRKGYIVTFKKVDPLFVIDLSDHENPEVLGKLKIPGYSDYLHPYDENHIIGIGKETVEAEESLKEGRQLDFAWYQGIKMAIFDVSDVENPIEMHKVVIGDRGTESEALHDHKAFLFDKERELLVIPITLAEIKGEKSADNQYGEFVFQGAYAYNINLEDGFELRGRVTHYDDDDVFKKSGYYFRGDSAIRRSLYIEDVLYTFSNTRLQLNGLDGLERLKVLEFE